MNLWKNCAAEFLGAFTIVFAGCGAIAVDQVSGGALGQVGIAGSFGLAVMIAVYALGHVGGGHFNPAVTLALAVERRFSVRDVVPYLAAQHAGAVAASLIHAATLRPLLAATAPGAALELGVTRPLGGAFLTAFVWEFLLTFLLMIVIVGLTTDRRAVRSAAGLAIGGTVGLEALFAGPICGASMNPARSFGPALVSGDWANFGAYVAGPVLGAVAAARLYALLRDKSPAAADTNPPGGRL